MLRLYWAWTGASPPILADQAQHTTGTLRLTGVTGVTGVTGIAEGMPWASNGSPVVLECHYIG
ncbi:hypothetical protein [Actinoallomurus soli]|uniref:hypothetical protein n=1 Tax=Actinoallomurus soli TaxID=2952535 RepID=UPI002093B90D|nr:hypothetical protein [Actinoallomurus soli]MCO5973451.1 hypothetical protein [Actinoallomurus soli]